MAGPALTLDRRECSPLPSGVSTGKKCKGCMSPVTYAMQRASSVILPQWFSRYVFSDPCTGRRLMQALSYNWAKQMGSQSRRQMRDPPQGILLGNMFFIGHSTSKNRWLEAPIPWPTTTNATDFIYRVQSFPSWEVCLYVILLCLTCLVFNFSYFSVFSAVFNFQWLMH